LNEQNETINFSEIIAEDFGSNASYVETLFNRFLSNPTLVDEAWRAYFTQLVSGYANVAATAGNGNGSSAHAEIYGAEENGANGVADFAAMMSAESVSPSAASSATSNINMSLQTSAPAVNPLPRASTAAPIVNVPQTSAASQTAPQTIVPQTAAALMPSVQTTAPSANATPAIPPSAEVLPIRGGALKIVENMETSLSVPTATSLRRIPVKVLEENRLVINRHLKEQGGGKASFTHLIGFAILRALEKFPQMNDGFAFLDGQAVRIHRKEINFGVAIDIQKRDGSRTLLVPNIKNAGAMSFSEFLKAYDDVVKRARDGKLTVADFQDTTVSITNPGTLGTVSSTPRLMAGQSLIVATGAIEYPAEYQAMSAEALSLLGVSKTVTITSTYDHRVIQGAESGAFLALMHELLLGEHDFYAQIFADLKIPYRPYKWSVDNNPAIFGDHNREQTVKQARVLELINAYRVRGHLIADLDPLHAMPVHHHPELDIETYGLTIWDLDRKFITGGLARREEMTLREILDVLHRAYCGKVGIEYRHIISKEQKSWIREQIYQHFVNPQPVPVEVKKQLLWKLIEAEQFERFLHTKYLGQKRFSVEGTETVIALLDQLIEGAAARGVEDITMGMAHRGRLNVLANVLGGQGAYAERIFTIFEGTVHPQFPADEGDVKYHQGAHTSRTTASGKTVDLTLSPNPSHLEFVDPVVEGMVRAKQDKLQEQGIKRRESWTRVMPVLLHGDAAFAGQGTVMETLNLTDLLGYRTGGTIHIVVNNQIGFTTSPEQGRSTLYSTDVAKMTDLPIFHVNADDPEAAWRVLQIALDFRQQFNKDVVIDVIGFRRLGHNEGDEPSYTQPLMYARVREHEGVRAKYAKKLIAEKVLTEADVKSWIETCVAGYEQALANAKRIVAENPPRVELPAPVAEIDGSEIIPTGISAETVRRIGEQISHAPEGFHINPKMTSQLARRAKMGDGSAPMDWAFAEACAFGSLVLEGTDVRLSGQDSGRGTFSQRHAVLYDTQTGARFVPLSELKSENPQNPNAHFEVYDSSLSELGVLGFEYGYSVIARDALVMWEAQFGDFANGAQVIIDQFIASGEDKWQQRARLTMLLPHGYEGQGPEHSSARLERFLQLCAENNMQVCYPTTPAQYFHLLRRQVKQERAYPLVVMTPKSLLRLPAASSRVEELTTGGFRPAIDDSDAKDKNAVERIVLCSGKVFYDLHAARVRTNDWRVAIVRLEQFYPFPTKLLREILATYPNARELVWAQEEPQNMGGWHFVEDRLRQIWTRGAVRYVGRAASASPAIGSYAIHELEQKKLVDEALTTSAPIVSNASTKENAGQAAG
jgi:2-oxoglutarate decarboxylase